MHRWLRSPAYRREPVLGRISFDASELRSPMRHSAKAAGGGRDLRRQQPRAAPGGHRQSRQRRRRIRGVAGRGLFAIDSSHEACKLGINDMLYGLTH